MEAFVVALQSVWNDSGFSAFTMGHAIMMLVGIILLYLAIGKGFEPLLLSPIAFGCLLANVPKTGFEDQPGVMQVILYGINHEIFPPLIFLGVGAMTDFGPLIANPKTLLLGAAAQAGVFVSLLGAMMLGFTVQEASAIGIIGGADGPTAIYLAAKMAPNLLGAIAVAAYSYMSLVPLIQPPIMKLCTTEADRKIVMEQLRPVSHFERIVFPVVTTIVISLLLPPVCSLIGMLMLGNLFKEAGCLDRLSDTAQNALMNIVTIMLATGTGLTMKAESFLNYQTILIIVLGLIAFAAGTFAGVVFGKLMCILDGGKTNPLIGSAGVSAVPMAARVSQIVGQKANPANFLLMHAMGPNVAGVIGTAVAAGAMLAMIGPVK
ncbi:sodium ion-translocating decarboxylase subunit beta [Phascolarctobacterium faecium]|jgi:sodium ion-translocating decarboxylase beta subunit|uniref:Sodium ion-translocating decarboxylase subunit beta n=15 Tax=Phascolarctobacterium TaxID=33024 RepID=A0A3G9H010_9FIRM|nr:sodium ion-translocating decarboxylase subunit beta [Phascolarctobacterium faecium]MBP6946712.1 sodium ion-translocating decarboxylase subunit beta [Phascolarctobacterium sp.]MBP8592155.1 sodium ion-translocating decarboxylase subunit beta [Phascolarctobacterium sp.]MCQ5185369.1 sodium ion-translocating decarboxylase subunit beta [Phascolarctobacterium faecium]MCQ5196926.1 sodium ion-translocating decarboxylase subunit beta [Phascolarctobacterium faecium]MTS79957.1 sodium ion-translocating 